ncbi:MAG: MFS transporter [Candidatus Helarchaeota archaeon]|nr:MFS transporter [Candidatus Helarchaeota archaeon]
MKKRDKIIYGSGRFGSSLLLQLVGFLNFYLYFEIFLLDPWLNGVANAIAMLVIAYSGFHFGYISDKIKTRWGRRKPFILIGSPGLAITFIMLFIPHLFGLHIVKVLGFTVSGDDITLFIYKTIFISSFNFFYGFLLTPYQSWLPELTEEHERLEVSAYQNLFNVAAAAVSSVITFTFPVAFTGKGMALIPYIVLVCGIIQIGGYILPFLALQEDMEKFVAQPELKKELKVVWENKNYLGWQFAQGLFSIAFTIIINSMLGFIGNILMFNSFQLLIAAGMLVLMTIIMWKTWSDMSKKKSKHWSLSISLIFFTLVIPLSVFGLVPNEYFGYVYIALLAASISSWYLFPYAIIADMAEDDELRTGEKRAGMYTGFNSIPLNVFQAVAMLVSGMIFSVLPSLGYILNDANKETIVLLSGYINLPSEDQIVFALSYLLGNFSLVLPNPVSSGYIWFGPITVIFMILGLLVFRTVKIDFNLEERRKSKS